MIRLLILLTLLSVGARAEQIYEFEDPVDRARFKEFNEELRCPQCQNQNLAGSDAIVSESIRRDLYEQIQAGRSDKEIIDDMVRRYGDYILYKPPFEAATAVLWIGPFVLLLLGALVLWRMVRKRANVSARSEQLSGQEQARIEQLLKKHDRGDQT